MKKLLAVALALIMLASTAAFAEPETIDLTVMTRDELRDLLNRTRAELFKYEIAIDGDTVIYDEEDLKVIFRSYEVKKAKDGTTLMEFEYIIENKTDTDFRFYFDDVYINGWEKSGMIHGNVNAKKKSKEKVSLKDMEEVEVTSQEELEEMEFKVSLYDDADGKYLYKTNAAKFNFK